MIKRFAFLLILLVVALLTMTFSYPGVIVVAKDIPTTMPIGTKVVLDKHIEAVYMGKALNGDNIWQATIGAPKYLDDLSTLIECRWIYDVEKQEWVSGANLFTTIVKDSKVTVTYTDKKLSWQPDIYIGKKKLTASFSMLLPVDPINENYFGNTLQWDYGDGITRNLRLIEGMLIEYYTINTLPADNIIIKSNLAKDEGFIWNRPVTAWDANNELINLVVDEHDVTLTLDAMKSATFPITIDPDTTFTTSSSDGQLQYLLGITWAEARNAGTAHYVRDYYTTIGIWTYAGAADEYTIFRGYLYFNTSSIPDTANVTGAVLQLYPYSIEDEDDLELWIQSGMPTYPHDPLVVSDYDRSVYSSTDYGHADISSAGWTTYQYYNVTLANLSTLINKAGYTKLCLRERRDVENDAPGIAISNELLPYAYEKGSGYRPKLVITYTASSIPTITTNNATYITMATARLNAYLTDDGGEFCDVRFQYGNSTGNYTVNTTWVNDTYITGQSPYNDTSGLTPSTTYYFRVQAGNTLGIVNGTEKIFTTSSDVDAPTNFRAYPASRNTSLSWVKGLNSTNTKVRVQVGAYPANYTDGTHVYFDIGGTVSHTGLTAGVSYYYRAWGESGGTYSTGYAEIMTTTVAGIGAVDVPSAPTVPSKWFGSPDYTNMENTPFYSVVNDIADNFGMPRNTFWLILTLGMITAIALFVLAKSHSGLATITTGGILIILAATQSLLPLWIIFAYIAISVPIFIAQRQI